jgi:hypothetical protein
MPESCSLLHRTRRDMNIYHYRRTRSFRIPSYQGNQFELLDYEMAWIMYLLLIVPELYNRNKQDMLVESIELIPPLSLQSSRYMWSIVIGARLKEILISIRFADSEDSVDAT